MKTRFTIVICILLIQFASNAQMKVGDNPTIINSASLLELETTNKGLVLPRVSITNVSASSPLPAGLLTGTMVYNTNNGITGGSGIGIYYWDGSKWNFVTNTATTSGSYWSLTGNSGTSASTNFIGTTDAIDFVGKTNNTERMRILGAASGSSQAGWIGMGISVPRSSLDVTGNYTNKNVLTLQNTSASGFTSIDMLDNTGNLKGTFGYANASTGGNFASRAYFNSYGSDLLFTANSGSYHLFLKGNTGYVGINTNTPSERLHVVGNIYLNGAFMPGGNAGTSGYVLTSTGAGTSPTWTSPNSLSWNLTGNSGTSATTSFLGTTDNISMRFRTNNIQRMIIDSLGRVGIGLPNPSYALSILSQTNPLYLSGVQATSTFSTDSVLTINAGVVKKAPYSSLTGNFWSLTGNAGTDYATNYIGTSDNVSLRFRTNNTERMLIDSIGRVAIGTSTFSTYDPKLLVDNSNTTSNTVVKLNGNINDYLQINIQNKNGGSNASTDYVATADDGTDSTFYIDMGINSSTYAPSVENFGGPHDGYLYTYARNLVLGTDAPNSDVIFLLGGGKIKNNAIMRLNASDGHVIIGKGENTNAPIGTTVRGPNAQSSATNTAGGILSVQGGSATGTATGGALNLSGGASSGTGTGGSVNINGGGTSGGSYGAVNINAGIASATYINTGNSSSNITMGGGANNILLPKFTTVGGMYYTSLNTGQISTTGSNMTWDSINNRLGVGLTNPGYKLSVLGTNPLYLSGVQATGSFATDSVLTILNGVVKKAPYSSLSGNFWSLTGNASTNPATNYLGTADANPLVIKVNGTQAGYIGISGSSYATSLGVGSSGSSTAFQSTAIGAGAQATGANSSLAVGYNATAATQNAIAIGTSSLANTNNEAIAIGYNSKSNAFEGIAIGTNSIASTNNQTIAIGTGTTASGFQGIAIGYGSSATTNNNALAIGVNSMASGYQSTAIGNSTSATAQNATAIGNGATTNTANTLILGNGVNVGIGTSTPAEGLDVSNKNIIISNTNNTAGQLKFQEPSTAGSNYVAFKAPVTSVNTTYTLPASDGVANQVLSTNGSGTLSWASNVVGTAYSLNSGLYDPTTDLGGTYAFIGEVPVSVAASDALLIQGFFSAQATNPTQTSLVIRVTRSLVSGSLTPGTAVAYSGGSQNGGTKYYSIPIYKTESGLTTGTWYYKLWATSNDVTTQNYNLTVLKVH